MSTPATPVPCATCGTLMDPASANYNTNGDLICRSCETQAQIGDADKRIVSTLMGSAIGVLAAGAACVATSANLVSIGALVGGIAWLVMIGRNADHRSTMGKKLWPAVAIVVLGMVLGGVGLVNWVTWNTSLHY